MFRNVLTVAAFLICFTSAPTSIGNSFTQPGARQALYFDVQHSGHKLIITPKIDSSVNGLKLLFDNPLKDNPFTPLPTEVKISPATNGKNDILTLLLPVFGFEYQGETHSSSVRLTLRARQHIGSAGESGIRLQLFAHQSEPVASLFLNTAANEAVLIENRPYAMGGLLLAFVGPSVNLDDNTRSCLKRAFSDSYVCNNPDFTPPSQKH